MKNKSGVSAVVATVLIVMITVAAVAIIWATIMPMIKNNLDDVSSKKANLEIVTAGGYTSWNPVSNATTIQIARGQDNLNISGIVIFLTASENGESGDGDVFTKGSSYPFVFNLPEDIVSSGNSKVYVVNAFPGGKPSKIGVSYLIDGPYGVDGKSFGEKVIETPNGFIIPSAPNGGLNCTELYDKWGPLSTGYGNGYARVIDSLDGCLQE